MKWIRDRALTLVLMAMFLVLLAAQMVTGRRAVLRGVGGLDRVLSDGALLLYHYDRRGRPSRLEIHHRPWSLQVAHATITTNTMAAGNHLALIGGPALLHVARRQDVVAWAPRRLSDRHHRSVRNVTEYRNSVTGGM